MWRRNPDRESKKQNLRRRVNALEIHIQDTEARYAELENRVNVALAWFGDTAPEQPSEEQ